MNCCPRSLSIRLQRSGRIRTTFSKKRMPMSDDLQALQNFSGIARLFPLPNVVLFPHLVLPLHIFEPRYRQMTTDALAGDRLIAMVLLQTGWEPHYEGLPALYPIACLGRIQAEQRLPDGRFNLQVRGLTRVRILEEINDDKLYRSAKVEMLQEQPPRPEADRKRKATVFEDGRSDWAEDETHSQNDVLHLQTTAGLARGC